MTPIRLRVFNIAAHANTVRLAVAIDTGPEESSVVFCDFTNREPGLTNRLAGLVVDDRELNNWLAQHGGEFNAHALLESKMRA